MTGAGPGAVRTEDLAGTGSAEGVRRPSLSAGTPMPAPASPGDHRPPVTPTADVIVEKRVFELPSYTTAGGATIRGHRRISSTLPVRRRA